MKRIIVHGGAAHLDDFVACALAMCPKCQKSAGQTSASVIGHSGPVAIERRDPTPEELDDPDVLVMAVGRVLYRKICDGQT